MLSGELAGRDARPDCERFRRVQGSQRSRGAAFDEARKVRELAFGYGWEHVG